VVNQGNTYATVLGKVTAVKWIHTFISGVALDTGPHLRMTLQGIKKSCGPPKGKFPVSMGLLKAIHDALMGPQKTPKAILLWGLITLGFFFMMRRSEFVVADDLSWVHCIRGSDLWIENGKVYIRFRSSKTDQTKVGCTRSLGRSGDPFLCPVLAAKWILSLRNSDTDLSLPVAVLNYGGECITYGDVASALKAGAARIGLQVDGYSCHSLRVGGATHLGNAGVSTAEIMFLGRWKSEAVLRYIHISHRTTQELSREMVGSQGSGRHE
jgi:hypothetical protein